MPNLSILVFVASPLDYARYRHTALYFEFEPQAEHVQTAAGPETEYIKSSVMEVIGSPGFMSFSERENWGIPVSSTNLARVIPISTLPSSIPISALRSTVSETLIRDGDTDWNSQNWVGDALGRLVGAGYLDSEARDRGLDAMVDVIMEAEDEEIAVVGT